MKIEHIAMYVNDLERAKDFFTHYFHAAAGEKYHNKITDFQSYFLSFQGECRLEIMNKPEMENIEKPLARTGYAHIALSVGTKETVNSLTEQLRKDGYRIISNPRTTEDGYYESCTIDFEDNQIEITI
ncbi:MAG: glyoxalase [Lachnospiraceae bacterium]|nr:glyoxalase [Lachnospiraceae bacterium]